MRILQEQDSSIAGQYIDFARTADAYRKKLGPNEQAVRGAIADCIERGVLGDYLREREEEVVTIMMTLYDEQEVLRNYIASERRDAAAKGEARGEARGEMKGEARGVVGMCKEFGISIAETIAKLKTKLGMSEAEAEATVRQYW